MKKILLLGTCRIQINNEYITSNGGWSYKKNDVIEKYEYHMRPFGSTTSFQQLYNEIVTNYDNTDFFVNNKINNYIYRDAEFERNFNHLKKRDIIQNYQTFIPYKEFDGYVFEISSCKFKLNNQNIPIASNAALDIELKDTEDLLKSDIDESFHILEKIVKLLGDKPIMFVTQYKSVIPDRYKIQFILSEFCSKHKNTVFFNPDYIIYNMGYLKCLKKFSRTRQQSSANQQLKNSNNKRVFNIRNDIPYINSIDESMYDNTHFTDEYHNELMYYYDDFFSLFI
jgi:hypothetical protein